MGMNHLVFSKEKFCNTFKLQKEVSKLEMKQDETFAETWRERKAQKLKNVKNDVLCTAFSYAGRSKALDDVTTFAMKDCLSLHGLYGNFSNR